MLMHIFIRVYREHDQNNICINFRNTIYGNALIFGISFTWKRMKLGLLSYSAALNEDYYSISNSCFEISMTEARLK